MTNSESHQPTVRRRRVFPAVAVGIFAVLATVFAVRARGTAGGPPLIVLISIDTCRADRLGVAGMRLADGSSPTPHLDRLAGEGRWFPEALTPAPLTLPAHVTVMSGLYPDRHGVRENDSFRVPTRDRRKYELLAEALREAGYDTAAFVAAQPLDRRFGLDQGFRVYDDVDRRNAKGGGVLFRERDAEAVTDKALAYVRETAGEERRFLFVHYFDAHFPYERRPDAPKGLPEGAAGDYLSEIVAVDRAVGRLLGGLPEGGAGAFVVVFGDHGEGLGDHGEATHGYFLHDSVLRVPLIVRPGRTRSGDMPPARPARLVDVAPTILDAVGVTGTSGEGESLLRPARGPFRDRSESLYAFYQHRYARLRASRDEELKLIEGGGRSELRAWRSDPRESTDLIGKRPLEAARLRAVLFEALAAAGADAAPSLGGPAELSGPYHGARSPSSPVEPTEDENRKFPHPADKADVLRDLDSARILVQRGEPARAALILRARAAERDDNPALLLWTGRAIREAAADLRLSDEVRRKELIEAGENFRLLFERHGDPRGLDLELLCLRDRTKLGEIRAADEIVRKASAEIAARGGTGLTFALRGLAKETLGNLAGAVEDLENAARREPEDPNISEDLARVRGLLKSK